MLLPLIVWIWTCEPEMPAVPIVAAIAVDAAATSATTALIGGIAASTFGVIGGAIVTGAVGGAIGGSISSAAFGGDPGISALVGAISNGSGGGVGSQIVGLSPIENAAVKVAGGLTTGTLAGLASGENIGTALKGGAVSGLSSGIASGIGAALDQGTNGPTERAGNERVFANEIPGGISAPAISTPQPSGSSTSPTERSGIDRQLSGVAQSALSYGIKSGLNDVFGSNVPTAQPASAGFPSQPTSVSPPSSTATTPGTSGPNIDALAQALRSVGDLGYSPGGPVFGSQNNGPQRKVWNKASLRVTDDQNQ